LYPEQFEKLMRDIEALAPVVGKELLRTPLPFMVAMGKAFSPGISLKSESPRGASGEGVIAFSGEAGAFAEQALLRAFGEEAPRLPVSSFTALFDAVLEGKAQYGVVPIENSLAGSVHENYDLLIRYPDIAIVGEIKLRVVHYLIASGKATIDSIRVVRSHPQGFAQCRGFLDTHPDWKIEPTNDTAGAVASIARDGRTDVAAIAGEPAARIYGLTILKEGIETNPLNYTRFLIIARQNDSGTTSIPPSLGSGKANKASLVFSTPNEPGALFVCLKILSERGINLSKLESRPIAGKPWRYQFYVDITIPESEEIFEVAMDELKTKTEDFRFLGAYRASL
jgi:3-deoxy-7-phosphoheptulonate synthase